MNLKLNNDSRGSVDVPRKKIRKPVETIKEERRRTGRYIAILVGICLFLLAIYQAWVRRIPIVASLVVPALIMFIYVGWVLYTASRDKQKALALALDIEEALYAARETEVDLETQNNLEISIITSKETSKTTSPEQPKKEWSEISSALIKEVSKEDKTTPPVILVNDKPPEDVDQKWTDIVEKVCNNEMFKGLQTRRKFKRKFCRRKRLAVFKRSYSIA